MEAIVDHILAGLAVVIALVALLRRRSTDKRVSKTQRLEDIVRKSIVAGKAHQVSGVPLARTCAEYAIMLDLMDGKRDFSDQQIYAEVVAELATYPADFRGKP